MFKNFKGFDLIEKYQKAKKAKKDNKKNSNAKLIKILFVVAVSLILWFLPSESFGIENLTAIEQRVISIFAFAVLMWILEAIPSWATSMMVVVLLLVTCSDGGLDFLTKGADAAVIGTTIKYKSLMACFADPIIMLFIGGFVLAIAATKSGLDSVLAKALLKPFGTQSKFVLLGFLLVTAIFSMFLSNTATAAMMLTFLTPVLKALPADGKGKIALAMAIPVAANIGGIGTPIGTPPNAIALKALNTSIEDGGLGLNIGFGDWMMFMMPFTILLIFIGWFILVKMFPFKAKTIELDIKGENKKDWRSTLVKITFIVTILLWMTDKLTGLNANVVAMIPVGVFCATGIITRNDLSEINWSVLWMVAGGFALGVALNESGLAAHMINSIPFDSWAPLLVIIGSGLICYTLSNFISNTATAALLVPILAVIGKGMGSALAPLGGVSALLIGIAIAASLAMVLPISTPPNALAHATGMIEQKDMVKTGLIMGIVGLILGYTMLIVLGSFGII
ncbi:MAG: SLC13/DASS family transporter [Bacteroidales bacterium]|nr:SLC13/DASS family transporter [Bacteroidales bacterium]